VAFTDDGPAVSVSANAAGSATVGDSLLHAGAATLVSASLQGNDPDVNPGGTGTVYAVTTSAAAAIIATPAWGADGPQTPGNPAASLSYALTTGSANPVDSGLTVTDGSTINLVMQGGTVVGLVSGGAFDGKAAFAVAIDATGHLTVEQYLSVFNPTGPVSLTTGSLSVVVTATDFDNTTATSSVADISSEVIFTDATPTLVAPVAASIVDTENATSTFTLNATSGGVATAILYGADGPEFAGATNVGVQFDTALNGTAALDSTGHQMTSSFQNITYQVVNNGLELDGVAGGQTVFKIVLDPASNQYTVTMIGTIDLVTNVEFSDGGYQFVGGNSSWAGFTSTGSGTHFDLLLTPKLGGAPDGTVNTSSVAGGISSGNSVDSGDTFRIDFVTNLAGNPKDGSGDYDTAANRDWTTNGQLGTVAVNHWDNAGNSTNGANALFISSSGASVHIVALDYGNPYTGTTTATSNVIDAITAISINYNGVTSALITAATLPANHIVNVGGHNFTVTFNAGNGSVDVAGVVGTSGAQATGTRIAVFTANGYDALEYGLTSGTTVSYKIGHFGAAVPSTQPITFVAPVYVVDGDGNTTADSNISVTVTPPVAPPIVLDMGSGIHYLGLDAGVHHDYGGGLMTTAWVGASTGILALHDQDAYSIMFSTHAGQTDLQGLAQQYDGNLDGIISSADAVYSQLGVWIDANTNGKVEGGEYHSLAELGIVSINLTSDGQATTAANGDVIVFGQTTYTRADGSTGTAADVGFALAAISAAAGALLGAETLVAPTLEPDPATAPAATLAIAEVSLADQEQSSPQDAQATSSLSGLLGSDGVSQVDSATADHSGHEPAQDESSKAGLTGLPDAADHAASPSAGGQAIANAAISADHGAFDFGGDGTQMMGALMAMTAPPAMQAVPDQHGIQQALADTVGSNAVEALVNHFASISETVPGTATAPQGLPGLLMATVQADFMHSGMHMDLTHMGAEAHALAAAHA
jgi:hypothetical protein